MQILRIIAVVFILVLASLVLFLTASVDVDTSASQPVSIASEDYASAIDTAKTNYELNSATTDNVYQQQVVAQWGIKDLVEVTALQNAAIIRNQSVLATALSNSEAATIEAAQVSVRTSTLLNVMLYLVILMLGVIGLTMMRGRRSPDDPEIASTPDTGDPTTT